MPLIVNKIQKIKDYSHALVDLLRERVRINKLRKDPSILIQSLRRQGVEIEDDVIISSPETLNIDLTRPSLISVKGGGYFVA